MITPPAPPALDGPSGELLPTLGAILAGGASRRFGATKALASIGGRALAERVAAPLGRVVTSSVVITGDARIAELLGLPSRSDEIPGQGPLAGIRTALEWARELGFSGAICVACDLPFVTSPLLRAIATAGLREKIVTVPESESRRAIEPLCAWYPVTIIAAVEAALETGDRSIRALIEGLPTQRLGLDELAAYGDSRVLFLNVNTPEAAAIAERIDRQELAAMQEAGQRSTLAERHEIRDAR